MASADILRAAHKELPWLVHELYPAIVGTPHIEHGRNSWFVATCGTSDEAGLDGIANAAFIVRACNAHYQMLEALKEVRSLVCEAAETGFNCFDGSWAERLYTNNGRLSAAIAAAERKAGQ